MPAVSTIAGIIRKHGAERPDTPALIFGDRTYTYGEVHERSSRLANALVAELSLSRADIMSTNDNTALVAGFYEAFNTENADTFRAILSPAWCDHPEAPGQIPAART